MTKLCLLGLCTILFSPMAFAASPMINIVPSTTSLTVRSDGSTSVIYTVGNNLRSMTLSGLQINPAYHSMAAGLTLQNDHCTGTTLAPGASCQFGVVIPGSNQPSSFSITPSVCNMDQQTCSVADSSHTLSVTVDDIKSTAYAYFGFKYSPAEFGLSMPMVEFGVLPVNTSNNTYGTPVTGLHLALPSSDFGAVTVSLDGSRVYAAEEATDGFADIAVLSSGANSQLLKRIALPTSTNDSIFNIAISPNGHYLLLTATDLNGHDGVYKVDLSTDQVTTVSGSFSQPLGVAISPDGHQAYVANFTDGTTGYVSVINLSDNSLIATLTEAITNPQQLAISPDGAHLYIGNLETIAVYTITNGSDFAYSSSLDLTNRTGLTVSSDGNTLYAAHFLSGSVTKIDTRTLATLATLDTNTNANAGIALTPNNASLFIAATSSVGYSRSWLKAPPIDLNPGVFSQLNTSPLFTSLDMAGIISGASSISCLGQYGAYVN